MKEFTLTRLYRFDTGTLGTLSGPGFSCNTVERPDKQNIPGESCIPEGEYIAVVSPSTTNSPHFEYAYELQNVPGRTLIKIHIANFPSELKGCIGLGKNAVINNKAPMVTNSVKTITEFHKVTNKEPIKIIIK